MDSEPCDVSHKPRRSSKKRLWPSVPRRKRKYNKNKRPLRSIELVESRDVSPLMNLEERRASTSSAAEVSSTDDQFAEVPPTTELQTESPDVITQQPTSEKTEVVEEPKPLLKLRQPRPPPMTTTKSTRSKIRVAAGDKERLAGLIRGHPVLYNTHYAHFKDKAQTFYAWQDISRRMLRPDTECKTIWKLLKCNYSNALRLRQQRLVQGLNVKSSKYDKFMSFVEPFLKVSTNALTTTEATDEASSDGSVEAPAWGGCDVSRAALGHTAALSASPARSGYVQPQRNTIVELFRNLGETVKDFPSDVKIRVKSEVLKVVSDAREFILRNNTVEQLFLVEDIVVKEEPSELQ